MQLSSKSDYSFIVKGSELTTVVGHAKVIGNSLNVIATNRKDEAIVSIRLSNTRLSEADFLSSRIINSGSNKEVMFFWRTRSTPEYINTFIINTPNQKTSYTNLEDSKAWTGEVIEVGVFVSGTISPDQPLIINELKFSGSSIPLALKTLVSAGTRFLQWDFKAINGLGGAGSKSQVSFVLLCALWILVSTLLYTVWTKYSARVSHFKLTIFFITLFGWISLDLIWQKDLLQKSRFIQYQYSEVDTTKKHISDRDRDLNNYLDQLKNNFLPDTPSRIFIITALDDYGFSRSRAHFRLLPHNIYSYGMYPKVDYLRNGDWILVIGSIDTLRYNKSQKTLNWGDDKSVQAKLVNQGRFGGLYQVVIPKI